MFRRMLSLILVIAVAVCAVCIEASASDLEEIVENEIKDEAEYDGAQATNVVVSADSAILMDAETGAVLYSSNAHQPLPPASVTKIMTLLLVAEALADGTIRSDDKVVVSANAASMGGSQIFIKEGEEFTVEELVKSTAIASANDAAVSLAELIAGSEASFVDMMNDRAKELGMKNTKFENSTGLDDTVEAHLTSAYDIALMSRELLKHDSVMKYTNIWQDSIRGGEFVLSNTNRLVRYYSGCTGLKTGSTDKAGFCISATAERDGMHLIAVIMGSDTREDRNNSARALLDYGFANYGIYSCPETKLESVPVMRGVVGDVQVYSREFKILCGKSDIKKIEVKYDIPLTIAAPVKADEKVGEVIYLLGGNEIGRSDICSCASVDKINLLDLIITIASNIVVGYSR